MTNCNKQSEKDITQCILININENINKLKEDIINKENKIETIKNNIDILKKKIEDYNETLVI